MEFSPTSHISEPTADYILVPKVQSGDSETPSMPSADIDNVAEPKKEANIQMPQAVDSVRQVDLVASENNRENGQAKSLSPEGGVKENVGSSRDTENDSERTFSIFMRGRKNRKQTENSHQFAQSIIWVSIF